MSEAPSVHRKCHGGAILVFGERPITSNRPPWPPAPSPDLLRPRPFIFRSPFLSPQPLAQIPISTAGRKSREKSGCQATAFTTPSEDSSNKGSVVPRTAKLLRHSVLLKNIFHIPLVGDRSRQVQEVFTAAVRAALRHSGREPSGRMTGTRGLSSKGRSHAAYLPGALSASGAPLE